MISYLRLFLIIIINLKSYNSFAATVNGVTESTPMLVSSRLTPGISGGTIRLSGPSACTVSGVVKNFGTCTAASFLISGNVPVNNAAGRRVKVFISPSAILSSGTDSMNLAPSLSTNTAQVSNLTLSFASGIGDKTLVVPVYGTLTVASGKTEGNYTGTYTFYACSCCNGTNNPVGCPTTGCPTTFVDPRCVAVGTISGNSSSRIMTPISVEETTALNFGGLIPPISGTGTINQAGAVTNGVRAMPSLPSRSAGIFAIRGEASGGTIPYTLSFGATTTLSNGANTMSATLSLASGTTSRTLNATGNDTVTINGILTVPSGRPSGNYNGTYTVTVSY